MCGDMFGCHGWGRGCYWHLVAGGQGCCSGTCSAEAPPAATPFSTHTVICPNVRRVQVETPGTQPRLSCCGVWAWGGVVEGGFSVMERKPQLGFLLAGVIMTMTTAPTVC